MIEKIMTTGHLRDLISKYRRADEAESLEKLIQNNAPDAATRARASARAADYVRQIRAHDDPGLMEIFLAEYGLSTDEGIALMCLAEALLRVPDAETVDALIEDKIAPSQWGRHLGHSSSSLVNASTWALLLTGRVLREDEGTGIASTLRGAIKRLGEPVIRTAVGRAMRVLGQQFVLGETIDEAISRGSETGLVHSFDMLGEAALTADDAEGYRQAYSDAIGALACTARGSIAENPGISIKLSALHPRYEVAQRARVMGELVETVRELARQAASSGIGLNIDAEEADRLELSLDVAQAVLEDPALGQWEGFGLVVQAYGQRAGPVIDWFDETARQLNRKVTLRLVKGAYWDTEIKRAQVAGLPGFPVFTRKSATDVSYLCLAAKLFELNGRVFPQFATHNAQTMATILEMAAGRPFEFQRLHGMGGVLHDIVQREAGTRHRVYAPVGRHRDLLAYLVRRLLENGANSSFVHQILDESIAPESTAADPFSILPLALARPAPGIVHPQRLFPGRLNSRGFDLSDAIDLAQIEAGRSAFKNTIWNACPICPVDLPIEGEVNVVNPANKEDTVGKATLAGQGAVEIAVSAAKIWNADPDARRRVLIKSSELLEENYGEIFALLARESGKTLADADAELREAVDFLRYYGQDALGQTAAPRGVIVAISPWNFPLAIFIGQIGAALAAGNAVIAKPAEATPLIAHLAVSLLHQAGVPETALQLLPGRGNLVGAELSSNPGIAGVSFTGSTTTAQTINRSMAANLAPHASLIAETGGLNAMIVDSTALPEQAVRDILTSAFRSAGQRCSALRIVYVQSDIAEDFVAMLTGAMDELRIGDPWLLSTDVGPVIDSHAEKSISDYIELNRASVRHQLVGGQVGSFVPPTLIEVPGISTLTHEVFGPVLHLATFEADEIDQVVKDINECGYGLTFGMHSRIDDRVAQVTAQLNIGNIYINRNQIGAIVGSQPFGGEGLSGTGPKAGGPDYVARLIRPTLPEIAVPDAPVADAEEVCARLERIEAPRTEFASIDLPGPTGESNRLAQYGRGPILCLGPTAAAARAQGAAVRSQGGTPILVAPGLGREEGVLGLLDPEILSWLPNIALVADWSEPQRLRNVRIALSQREGPIVGLAAGFDLDLLTRQERHLSIDTTAAGGNARLLAAAD